VFNNGRSFVDAVKFVPFETPDCVAVNGGENGDKSVSFQLAVAFLTRNAGPNMSKTAQICC